ncbi:hypothetical protein DFJ63DRAFT_333795 [Scheffersomyces coipomensis]|uniref:uncharacterized protein n=1 Tax=Scheffersomyces coipomensis TaxID=1788519 RepID=UPI00315DD902
MIQKFTCVPKSDYEVIIVSNGTINQVESKLIEINEHTNNEIPFNSSITYLDNFNQLITHLNKNFPNKVFNGKVLFMFFNGLTYIQNFLSDLIDHYNKCTILNVQHHHQQQQQQIETDDELLAKYFQFDNYTNTNKLYKSHPVFEKIENVYFYFDSSVSIDTTTSSSPYDFLINSNYNPSNDTNPFNTVVTIANDILKKMSFMIGRIRGLYIDDFQLNNEKIIPLHCLMRNFPNVERIELSSYTQLLMKDMIL